jgi:hypothetical protein
MHLGDHVTAIELDKKILDDQYVLFIEAFLPSIMTHMYQLPSG